MKRVLALILAVTLAAGLAINAAAYTGVSSWAKGELDLAQQAGLIPQSLDNADLSLNMTRRQMCELAVQAFQTVTGLGFVPTRTDHFSDTADSDVCVACELGLVNGYPDGTFRPEKNLTRQEFAKILAALIGALGWDRHDLALSGFPDGGQVAAWAREAADTVITLGLIQGSNNGALNPAGNASRQEVLCVMLRAYKLLKPNTAPSTPAEQPTYQCSPWAAAQLAESDALGLIPELLEHADLRQKITRRELTHAAVLLCQKTGYAPQWPNRTGHFPDANDAAVDLAFELGIVNGVSEGVFKPDALLTRQQLFKVLASALNICKLKLPSDRDILNATFTDAAQIAAWAQEPVALLNQMKILRGNTDGTMAPKRSLSFQQGILMIYRTYATVKDWYKAHPLSTVPGPLTVNKKVIDVVRFAQTLVGLPYLYGGSSPDTGFDCSGFTSYVYGHFGYPLARSAAGQIQNGRNVSRDQMLPGDILIFSVAGDLGQIGHVALYIGGGQMIHAQSPSTGVCITPVSDYDARYLATRRIID